MLAKSSKNLVALSAADPKVVPKAEAASSALTAASTAPLEKSNNVFVAINALPAIAVFCNPDKLDANFLFFFSQFFICLFSKLF